MKLLALALLAGCLASCAAATHLDTPTGEPMVEMPTHDKALVTNNVLAELAPLGWSVVRTNDYAVLFERGVGDANRGFHTVDVHYRMTLTLVELDGQLLASTSSDVVAIGMNGLDQYDALRRQGTLDESYKIELQHILERVRAKLGGAPVTDTAVAPGPPPPHYHPPKPGGTPR
jgi:hypothetical protein